MSALFGFNTHSEIRDTTMQIPDQPLYLPYEIRTEMNWLDFSSTINPLGTPKSFIRLMHSSLVDGELSFTPDRDAHALRISLASRYNISPDAILCGSSASSMIQAAAQTYQPCVVGISVPSPIEYTLAIANAGHEVLELAHSNTFIVPDAATAERCGLTFDAAVLANPTYPTSRLLSKSTLITYLETCKWVIVDESLIELTLGGESMIGLTEKYRNLIVIRSFSNSFATPGVPISYCIAHPETISQMQYFYDSSSISMFAEVLAEAAIAEEAYIESTREMLDSEIPWMQCMLNLIPGIHIFPAEANFVMCSYEKTSLDLAVEDASDLVLRLQLAGFLVKKLEGMPGIISDKYFCVSIRTRIDNEKLLKAMRAIILKNP